MREIGVYHDNFTLPIVNQLFLKLNCYVDCAKMIHCVGIQMGFALDVYFCNTLVINYVSCGGFSFARKVFDEMLERDIVSWTLIISGYVGEGNVVQVFDLFGEMRYELEPNFVTVITVLKACNDCVDVTLAKQFHGYMLKKGFLYDKFVKNSLLQVYSYHENAVDVEVLFSEFASDVATWNILISFYSSMGNMMRVLECFCDMFRVVVPNVETLTLVASAMGRCGCLSQGQLLHSLAVKMNLCDHILLTCLMDLYAKCGDLESFVRSLEEIPSRNRSSVTWSTLMSGFIENGQYKMAVELFQKLQSSIAELTPEILAVFLDLCTDLGALCIGKEIHAYTLRKLSHSSSQSISFLKTSILNMYIKCGSLSSARHCFNLMAKKDVVAWSSMIEGLGTYGLGHEAVAHLDQMLKEGIEPTAITLLSALSACSHSGLTYEGCQILYSMKQKFGIEPGLNHYTCIVDLLGRSGKLKNALTVILKLVVFPDSRIWGALLAACRTHMDRKIGEYAAKRILELEPDNIGYHVVLSNLQASAEQWSEVEQLRTNVTDVNPTKLPGSSWIEVNGKIQGFMSGDTTHSLITEVYEVLKYLSLQLKDANVNCYIIL